METWRHGRRTAYDRGICHKSSRTRQTGKWKPSLPLSMKPLLVWNSMMVEKLYGRILVVTQTVWRGRAGRNWRWWQGECGQACNDKGDWRCWAGRETTWGNSMEIMRLFTDCQKFTKLPNLYPSRALYNYITIVSTLRFKWVQNQYRNSTQSSKNHKKPQSSRKSANSHEDLSRKAEKWYFPLESAYKLIEKPRTDRVEQPRSR